MALMYNLLKAFLILTCQFNQLRFAVHVPTGAGQQFLVMVCQAGKAFFWCLLSL